MMRKNFLLVILLFYTGISFGQTKLKFRQHSVNQALNILKKDNDLRNGSIGFYAIDVNSGEVIAEYNKDLCLKPASTMKLITSAAALDVLGANFRFETKIGYTGYIDTSTHTLHGNIVIKGGGDPTLGSKYFYSTRNKQFLSQWTKAIKSLCIDTITGRVIADASIYSRDMLPPTWSWEDFGNYFGAGACGLTVFDDMYTLYFNTSSVVGGKTYITKVEPEIPGMTFDNTVVASNVRSDRSYIFGSPYTYHRFIRGELPKGRTDYKVKGSMPDPALFTAQQLNEYLKSEGVVVVDTPITLRILRDTVDVSDFKIITITKSPTLADIISVLNTKSINLFAEHLLIHTALKLQGVNDTKSATNVIESYWASKGMDIGGLSINDGSGLSYYNYVSPRQLVFVLDYMHDKSKNFEVFYNSLPVSGKNGTLRRVCVNTVAQGKIHAKSGSIRKVRCYAGYTTSVSNREIAFAMMLNNFNCSDAQARKKLEKLMIALVQLSE
jgi:D-alanyl-D-alanine carboxypeptidase/D-alanyl-D-alanine-endopeptidase (penicillin-binding protein 4)